MSEPTKAELMESANAGNQAAQVVVLCDALTEARAEVARLEAQVRRLSKSLLKADESEREETQALRARVEALRAMMKECQANCDCDGDCANCRRMDLAIAADDRSAGRGE